MATESTAPIVGEARLNAHEAVIRPTFPSVGYTASATVLPSIEAFRTKRQSLMTIRVRHISSLPLLAMSLSQTEWVPGSVWYWGDNTSAYRAARSTKEDQVAISTVHTFNIVLLRLWWPVSSIPHTYSRCQRRQISFYIMKSYDARSDV